MTDYSIKDLCADIHMAESATNEVLAIYSETDFSFYTVELSGMMSIDSSFQSFMALAKKLGADARGMKILTVQLECARLCKKRYMEQGIDSQIYIDTMSCFSRFVNEYFQKHQENGFDCPWWAYRQLNMSIFRLGALEFEYEDEKRRINIHIPSDARFTQQAVFDSLSRLNDFTKKNFPQYVNAEIGCHTWLLSPILTPLLEHGSNILAFQELFEIKEVFEKEEQYIGFLFQADVNTPIDCLKEKTSLQKRVKGLMQKGIGVGAAYGALRKEIQESVWKN